MRWIILFLAGFFEIVWACSMKYSYGFSVAIPTIITIVGYTLSAIFLSISLKYLPLGMTYAIWTGLGIIGTTLFSIFIFNEKLSIPQIICIFLIILGIIGLKILTKE